MDSWRPPPSVEVSPPGVGSGRPGWHDVSQEMTFQPDSGVVKVSTHPGRGVPRHSTDPMQ